MLIGKGKRFCKIILINLVFLLMTVSCSATVWTATNDSTLSDTLSNALSGDTIYLEDGTYGKIDFTKNDIYIVGSDPKNVIFDLSGDNIEMQASGCTLEGVSVINSSNGVEVEADDCNIVNCIFDSLTHKYGIFISKGSDNLVFENNIVKKCTGDYFAIYSLGNGGTFTGNVFSDNDCVALCLYIGSKSNTVSKNNFQNNTCAIDLWGSGSGNKIYLNNFYSNDADIVASITPSSVIWNTTDFYSYFINNSNYTTFLGNYWDTYDGDDLNQDGIGDTSYAFLDSIVEDNYPLMAKFENYVSDDNGNASDLVPISFDSETVVAEQPNRIRVRIENSGTSDAGSFGVSLAIDGNELAYQIVTSLKAGENTSVAFTWLPPESGIYQVVTTVDYNCKINESNENNNVLVQSVSSEYENIDFNWYQFHKDVEHTGFYPGNAPDTNELLWVSAAIDAVTSSSPVVAEGKVFVNCDENGLYATIDGPEIKALDMYTGEYEGGYGSGSADYSSWASPCYYNGNVSCARYDSVNGGNMIVNGKVYVGDYSGSHYYCSYESNGTEIWSYKVNGNALVTPAYSEGMVYFSSCKMQENKGDLYCVDADTGELIWHKSVYNEPSGTASIYNDIVYFTKYNWNGDGGIYAMDKHDGTVLWEKTIRRTDSCPACAYGNIYLTGGYSTRRVYCFNATTGETVWETDEDDDDLGGWSNSPAVAGGKVFVGKTKTSFSYDYTYALDAFSGEVLWSYNGGGASPAISDGIVYTIGDDGRVYAFGNLSTSILPKAAFTSNVTIGESPLSVAFSDASVNASSWEWDFENDGTVDSIEQNPVYVFNQSGVYAVSLKVSNSKGSDIELKKSYITVTEQNSTDWNPWNDIDSDEGIIITGDEFHAAVKCWLTMTPVPETGEELTGDRFQELIHDWLVQ
ncbi:parallel beta-helix repeat (two copies) [Methanolobus tindarius DSM 2278]|uniref:Parallel beta-helix repeat (Two copies) n=2 Tax=Methanolobus tindarius TaxID=2221 RepID=W9DPB7_METTI|nr:parallel beta-helix repeat (two copies) [Methanolobus tindarius DSM 2278]